MPAPRADRARGWPDASLENTEIMTDHLTREHAARWTALLVAAALSLPAGARSLPAIDALAAVPPDGAMAQRAPVAALKAAAATGPRRSTRAFPYPRSSGAATRPPR